MGSVPRLLAPNPVHAPVSFRPPIRGAVTVTAGGLLAVSCLSWSKVSVHGPVEGTLPVGVVGVGAGSPRGAVDCSSSDAMVGANVTKEGVRTEEVEEGVSPWVM